MTDQQKMKSSQDRAEIIALPLLAYSPPEKALNTFKAMVAAQIDEAVREALGAQAIKQGTFPEIWLEEKYTEGFRAALDEVAKDIASQKGCGASFPNCDECDCPTEHAERIRALKEKKI